MHARTYAEKEVVKATRLFVCVKLDPGPGGEAKRICEKWKIGITRKGGEFEYPIAIALAPDQAIVDWRKGFVEPGEFASFLFKAAAAAAGQGGEGAQPGGGAKVAWEESYEKAQDTASFEGKMLLLAFLEHGEGSASARMLAETFADPAVAGLAKSFACVKVNPLDETEKYVADSYRKDVEKAGVAFEFPLVVILTKDLDMVSARSGFVPAADLAAMLKKALGK